MNRSITWCDFGFSLGIRPPRFLSVFILNGLSGTCGNNGIAQTIVRLEHGEPDFGEATNPVGQGLWRVTPKVLSNSKHTLLCL